MCNNLTKIEVSKYLKRIKFEGDIVPNLDSLKKLQEFHLLNIPFENLDIHNGIPIILTVKRIFNKIINQSRGGFCYELNGLFIVLLKTLGFDAKMISARVFDGKYYGAEYDHLTILVKINGIEYLTDVGFGEFTFHPIEFKINKFHSDIRGTFIIENYENNYFRLCKIENEERIPQFIFTDDKRKFEEFSSMCEYHQSSPDSHFTQKKVITIPNHGGRITLNDHKLKITKNEKSSETKIVDENMFKEVLKKYFNIKI